MNEYNPYQPPTASVIEREDVYLTPANRGTRLAAKILDAFISFGSIGIVAAIMIPALLKARQAKRAGLPYEYEIPLIIAGGLLVLVCLGIWAWNLVWLHHYGQTIGKRILKIKIVRTDGSRISLGRIIGLRWLPVAVMGGIPYLGYIAKLVDSLLIFRSSHQCLHDQFADTIVVKCDNF